MGRLRSLYSVGVLLGILTMVNAKANVTIQLLTYSNPSFGLATNGFFCAYLSPDIPQPNNLRGALPPNLQNGGYYQQQQLPRQQQQQQQNRQLPRSPQQQQSYQNQPQYPQYQGGQPVVRQYPQQQPPNQQQFAQQAQQNPQRPNGFVPYQSPGGVPNQNQYNNAPQAQQQPYLQQSQQQQFNQYNQNGQNQQQNQNQQYPPVNTQQHVQGAPYLQNGPQYQQPQPQQQNQQNQYQQNAYQQNYYQQQYQDQSFPNQPQCQITQKDFAQPNWNECRFTFSTVFSSFGDEPLVLSTGLINLPSNNATIDFMSTTWTDKCARGNCADQTWAVPKYREFKMKPNVIEIVVTHFGDSVYQSGQSYTTQGYDQAQIVDTIAIDISDFVPSSVDAGQQPLHYLCVNGDQTDSSGNKLSTLSLSIQVQCQRGFFGKFCNMTNCTTYDNQTQVCASSIYPGQNLVCQVDQTNLQPINCSMCPYGVNAGRCQSMNQMIKNDSANLTGYIVGLAILGILLAIAIVIIIVGAITYRKHDANPSINSRRQNNQPPPGPVTKTTSSGWFGGTKSANPKNGSAAPTRPGGYTQAANEDPADSEWVQPPMRRPPVALSSSEQAAPPPPRPYNFPPAQGGRNSAGSTPENGSRREAAV